MTILVVAEQELGSLDVSTAKVVTAALAFGEEIALFVCGEKAEKAADEAAFLSGVSCVLYSESPLFEHRLAEPVSAFLEGLVREKKYSTVLFAATAFGKNCAPRVGALLDVMVISDAVKIMAPDTFERPIYAGNAFETVRSKDPIKVLTVRTSVFAKSSSRETACPVQVASVPFEMQVLELSSFKSAHLTKMERPSLSAARVVISGGRGMQSGENFAMLEKIADHLGAAIGASRAAVDAGFVPNDYQVGQTGQVVAPELYIAVGISGAIQHVAGMKDSRVIVAINKDPDCVMMQMADYALAGDLFSILPELDQKLQAFLRG